MPSAKKSTAKKRPAVKSTSRITKTPRLKFTQITEAEIALTAYVLYEERVRTGCPGSPEKDWFSALATLEQRR